MTELLKNAWLGWRDMTTPGKLAGVWLVALCYLLYHRKKLRQTSLLLYAAVSTAAVILPVTAVLLMLYQTRFYDYQWILAMIPVNTVIAMGGTLLLDWLFDNRRVKTRDKALVIGAMLFILALSGSKPETGWMVKDTKAEKAIA